MSEVDFPPDDTILLAESTFQWAKEALYAENAEEYLSLVMGSVEVDYTPFENVLRSLTELIHAQFASPTSSENRPNISVIPRGSFATRTAIKGHVDLDIDVIFPDDHNIILDGKTSTIKEVLGTDDMDENILFEKEGLKKVFRYFWTTLNSGPVTNIQGGWGNPFWLELLKPWDKITRSLPLQAKEKAWKGSDLPSVPIDIFIKVHTKLRGQDIIVGVDKDSRIGKRRYQTTTFIPTEGRWLGDRILPPVDRIALLSLKWWKAELKNDTKARFALRHSGESNSSNPTLIPISEVDIKSHHLLGALNALHDLNIHDDLYVPLHVSQPFTLRRVKEVMWKVLEYLHRAYSPVSRSLSWTAHGKDLDYFFPQYSYQTMETLFMEARSDWKKFILLMDSRVIPSFRDEIQNNLVLHEKILQLQQQQQQLLQQQQQLQQEEQLLREQLSQAPRASHSVQDSDSDL